jgi:betaine-aldehyde dehydrogenase
VVLKPSEIAPVNAMILAEVIHEAGLPPGVFNLVNGAGPVVGEVLASHPEVDMVSFTGSTRAGRRVAELAAQRQARGAGAWRQVGQRDPARCRVRCGRQGQRLGLLLNSGQTCSAHTRLLVPEDRYEEVKARPGRDRPLCHRPQPGRGEQARSLVSAAQRDRVLGFIEQGPREGAELVAGGPQRPAFDKGYFVQPTILRVQPGDTLAREGSSARCWSSSPTATKKPSALPMTRSMAWAAGCGARRGPRGGGWRGASAPARSTSTGAFNLTPFGYKQSGNGRENGVYGFEEFLEYKSLQFLPR